MEAKMIKELKKGEYFTLKPYTDDEITEARVYVKEDYDRSERKYYAYKWADIWSGRYFKGSRVVYIGFTF